MQIRTTDLDNRRASDMVMSSHVDFNDRPCVRVRLRCNQRHPHTPTDYQLAVRRVCGRDCGTRYDGGRTWILHWIMQRLRTAMQIRAMKIFRGARPRTNVECETIGGTQNFAIVLPSLFLSSTRSNVRL